jgi:hypothetical protein
MMMTMGVGTVVWVSIVSESVFLIPWTLNSWHELRFVDVMSMYEAAPRIKREHGDDMRRVGVSGLIQRCEA